MSAVQENSKKRKRTGRQREEARKKALEAGHIELYEIRLTPSVGGNHLRRTRRRGGGGREDDRAKLDEAACIAREADSGCAESLASSVQAS